MMLDQSILKALSGDGATLTWLRFYCLKRNGCLLLALPENKKLARLTLELYQPQSLKAKIMVRAVGLLINFRLHLLFPYLDLEIKEDSVLGHFIEERQQLGLLLGNPEADTRKTIAIYCAGKKVEDAKIGIGQAAKQSVEKEAGLIKSCPESYHGIPQIDKNCGIADHHYYTTAYITGCSPTQDEDSQILALLADWIKHFKVCKVRETAIWRSLKAHGKNRKAENYSVFIERLGNQEIKRGLYHGDFAPWNIKISEKGTVYVMDWEYARLDGLAGWDWLHYMIQRATLVSNHSATEVLADCRLWAVTPEGRAFLCAAGWGQHIEEWLGSYLVYSAWIAGFDREELLQVWSEGV